MEIKLSFFQCSGPLCRYAEDLYPLLKILAGPDGEDTACEPLPILDLNQVSIPKLKVYVIEDNGFLGVSGEIKKVQKKAAEYLKERGAYVEYKRIPKLKHSLDIWSCMMAKQNTTTFGELLSDGARKNFWFELLKQLIGTLNRKKKKL